MVAIEEVNEETMDCGQPCSCGNACPKCVEYWERMIREGYWDPEYHIWTEKGWKEICK